MKIQIEIGASACLLTAEQVEQLYKLLADCEVLEATWRGRNNGFYGKELDQDIAFMSFDAARHAQGVKVWPEATLNKWKTLIEYRKGESK